MSWIESLGAGSRSFVLSFFRSFVVPDGSGRDKQVGGASGREPSSVEFISDLGLGISDFRPRGPAGQLLLHSPQDVASSGLSEKALVVAYLLHELSLGLIQPIEI